MKKTAFLFGLLLLTAACGKKSEIKTHVEVRTLGDGNHITLPVVIPLSEKSISSFRSPVGDINPLFRGFVGTIMNLGASIGAGKRRLSLVQPIPEIPEEHLGSLKIKRIFFFIETEKKKEDFDFLRRLAVKISSTHMDRPDESNWEPTVETDNLDERELNAFTALFRSKRERRAEEWEKNSSGLLMIAYNQENQEDSLKSLKTTSTIRIIQTKKPFATRKYLEDNFPHYFNRIHTLNHSILVELKKNPIIQEMFKSKVTADAQKVAELEIGDITPCTFDVCLDLEVPDTNLIPLLRQGNAIKVDAYIDPKYAPKSFQLKGFLEFEVKIKSKL